MACIISPAPRAQADALTCTASAASPVQFASVAPFGSGVYDTWTTLNVSCSNAAPQRVIAVCPSVGAGSGGLNVSGQRLLGLGGGIIGLGGGSLIGLGGGLPFQIFQDPGHSLRWGSVTDASLGAPPLLTRTGDGPITATLYFRLYTNGGPLTPGTHFSAFDGLSAAIHYGEVASPPANCAAAAPSLKRAAAFPFTVSAPVSPSCLLNVTAHVDFGSFDRIASNRDASGALSVQCTSGTAYTVSLSAGNGAGATAAARRMTGPNGATMTYSLYRNEGRTLLWGFTAQVDTAGGTGSGAAVSFPVYGRVPPQPTPAPGAYSDAVIATVTY